MNPLGRQDSDNVDFAQRNAADEDVLQHPVIKGLRRVLPGHAIVNDREEARKFLQGFTGMGDAMGQQNPEEGPTAKDEPLNHDEFFSDIEEMRRHIPKKL